jgi:hypothetical protein
VVDLYSVVNKRLKIQFRSNIFKGGREAGVSRDIVSCRRKPIQYELVCGTAKGSKDICIGGYLSNTISNTRKGAHKGLCVTIGI